MSIDELHSQCTAIRALDVKFDYFARVVIMIIKPEYGYKADIKDKVFQLNFKDCIYFCSGNTSKQAEEKETEFICWGNADNVREVERLTVLKDFLGSTLSGGGLTFFPNKDQYRVYPGELSDQNYQFYFFENVLGDAVWLICSHASVEEVAQ